MGRKVLHVVPSKSGWEVKQASGGVLSSHRKKDNAVENAVRIAKHEMPSQVKIHKQNGIIQSERTYQKDPEKYPG